MARSEPNGRGTPGRIGIWQRVTVSAISFPACFRLDGRFRTGAHNPVPDSAQPRAFGLACVARGLAGMLLLVALAGAVASALPSVAGAASLTTSVSAVQTLTCPSGERIWSGDEPNCVPITCPAGTVHDSDSGYCVKPPPPPPPPPTAKWDSFPSDIGLVEATGPGGAPVTYSLPTADIGGTSLAVSCTPVSGSTFPVGATSVNCSATGLSNWFQVTVADTKPPTINLTGYPAGNVDTGTTVSFSASATDTVDGNTDPVTCQPASGFTSATATTVTVSCSATDNAKNAASASFNVPSSPPPARAAAAAAVVAAALAVDRGRPSRRRRSPLPWCLCRLRSRFRRNNEAAKAASAAEASSAEVRTDQERARNAIGEDSDRCVSLFSSASGRCAASGDLVLQQQEGGPGRKEEKAHHLNWGQLQLQAHRRLLAHRARRQTTGRVVAHSQGSTDPASVGQTG